MKEIKETTYDQYSGEEIGTFFSSEYKMINKIYKLKEKFPDEVDIRYVNEDGSILCHIPSSWFKISPKRKREMTDEERAAAKIRAEQMRKKKAEKNSNNT